MHDLIGFLGGALLAALILVVIRLLFGRKVMQACSIRLALISVVAVIALLALIAALTQ